MSDTLDQLRERHESAWSRSYSFFPTLLKARGLRVGVEVGVAFGGHCEAILKSAQVQHLYGVDSYKHRANYEDPMNLRQVTFDELAEQVVVRLGMFDTRFTLIRADSAEAVSTVPDPVDFVYLDANHSYEGVRQDLAVWYPKVRNGGVIGGHDYGHCDFPGVQQAVDEFFGRFCDEIHTEGEGVWWVEKKAVFISYFIPAYNCSATIGEAIKSIMKGNFQDGDELIITNDGSTDGLASQLEALRHHYPALQVIEHARNEGGGAARNTAVEQARHPLLFCLDSDNVLESGSVPDLKDFLIRTGADAASFREVRFFVQTKEDITHTWRFQAGPVTLADYLAGSVVPGASGNYLFTKTSWSRCEGYPESAGALDTWGFGFRQLATGSRMAVMPDHYYFHRYGHQSYWVQESQKGHLGLKGIQVIIPYLDLLDPKDVNYIFSSRGRRIWIEHLDSRPIRVRSREKGQAGMVIAQWLNQPRSSISIFSRTVDKWEKITSNMFCTKSDRSSGRLSPYLRLRTAARILIKGK